MAEISKLNLDGTDRDIKDSVARQKLTVVDPTAGQGMIQFAVDSNGNYGYKKVGADTVIPFKSGDDGLPYFTLQMYFYSYTSSASDLNLCNIKIDRYTFQRQVSSSSDRYIKVYDYDGTLIENITDDTSAQNYVNKIKEYCPFISNYFSLTASGSNANAMRLEIQAIKNIQMYISRSSISGASYPLTSYLMPNGNYIKSADFNTTTSAQAPVSKSSFYDNPCYLIKK